MNLIVKDSKHRHGNCVPFILTNTKTGAIVYKGSLKEVAEKLKITSSHATTLHQGKKVYKEKYTIARMGFNQTINLS